MSVFSKQLEAGYRCMFNDQCEAAEPDYLDEFTRNYNPDNVDWDEESEAIDAFCVLANELEESRTDLSELYAAAGITPGILSEVGLL